MNYFRYLPTAFLTVAFCGGLFAQSSVKEKFQGEYKQLVEDALHTSADDPAFWNNARQIVFGQRVPTTDIAKAKAIFASELKDVQARGSKDQTITVPAHSKVVYHGKPFCLQHDAPAPGANAAMWLIPNTALFPSEAQGIAKAVLRYSANHPADQNVVQTVLWAIRHADKAPLDRLGAAQESVLNAALPDGANKYYAFVGHLRKASDDVDKSSRTTSSGIASDTGLSSSDDGFGNGQPLTLEKSRQAIAQTNLQNAGIVSHGNLDPYNPADVNGILEQLRQAELNGERAQPQSISAAEEIAGIATDGAQSLESEDSTASQVPAQRAAASSTQNPEDNAYTQINENVAARVHTNSLTDSTVEIVNNGDTPYQFDTSDFIGMAKPVSQPTYITPPAGGGANNASEPSPAIPSTATLSSSGANATLGSPLGSSSGSTTVANAKWTKSTRFAAYDLTLPEFTKNPFYTSISNQSHPLQCTTVAWGALQLDFGKQSFALASGTTARGNAYDWFDHGLVSRSAKPVTFTKINKDAPIPAHGFIFWSYIKEGTDLGHVAYVVEREGDTIYFIEGNISTTEDGVVYAATEAALKNRIMSPKSPLGYFGAIAITRNPLSASASIPAHSSATTTGNMVSTATEFAKIDKRLAKEVLDYAKLSQAVYSARFTAFGSWNELVQASKIRLSLSSPTSMSITLEPMNTAVAGSTPPIATPGFYAAAYTNGQEIVIAFCGTDDFGDVVTDVQNFMGTKPEQYQEAMAFVQKVLDDAPPGVKITLTGHSLGGGLASYAALKFNKEAVVFNAAGLGKWLRDDIPQENIERREQSLVRNIDLKGDPVSALGGQVGRVYQLNLPPGMIDPAAYQGTGPIVAIQPHFMEGVIAALENLLR